MRYRKILLPLFILFLVSNLYAAKTSHEYYQLLQDNPEKYFPAVLLMSERPDVKEMSELVAGLPRNERSGVIKDYLAELVNSSQEDIKSYLQMNDTAVSSYSSLNICNGIIIEASGRLMFDLISRDDIYKIIDDRPREFPVEEYEDNDNLDELDNLGNQVTHSGAKTVWEDGYTGEGILVAIIDTGVNYNHTDLFDHLWSGGEEFPFHGWDFHNGDNDPMDEYGHGTKVAGILTGDGTSGDTTGIAPDLTLMVLKVRETMSLGTVSSAWNAQNFCLEHDVDVVSMSLGWGSPADGDREVWRTNYDVLNQAGIISFKSAGNNGTSNDPTENISVPGGVPSPWRHPDEIEIGGRSGLITVGAVYLNNGITSFSSRGPVTWQGESPWFDYPYDGELHFGLIKPDVVTLGSSGRTIAPVDTTGYTAFSMTSMAQPIGAGTAALLLQKNPDLSTVELDSIMQTTAVELGEPGKDNEYGAGRLDAIAASDAIEVPMGSITGSLTDLTTGESLEGVIVYSVNRPRRQDICNENNIYEFDHQTGVTQLAVAYPSLPRRPVYVSDEFEIFEDQEITLDIELHHGLIEYDITELVYPLEDYSDTMSAQISISNTGDALLEFRLNINTSSDTLLEDEMFIYEDSLHSLDPNETLPMEIVFEGDSSIVGERQANLIIEHNAGIEADIIPILVHFNSVEERPATVPEEFRISKIYPNPFNNSAIINYSLSRKMNIKIQLFDILGREVMTLKNGITQAGEHKIRIDGSELANGLYFVRSEYSGQTQINKIILLK